MNHLVKDILHVPIKNSNIRFQLINNLFLKILFKNCFVTLEVKINGMYKLRTY